MKACDQDTRVRVECGYSTPQRCFCDALMDGPMVSMLVSGDFRGLLLLLLSLAVRVGISLTWHAIPRV